MASYQYVYHMDGVSKTYPGGKKVFENIRLNFLPGVKIGVVGVNGAGKSTLLRVMAGWDKDFQGEAWAAKGAKVGYLPQEPHLDPALSVRENVKLRLLNARVALLSRNDSAFRSDLAEADQALQRYFDTADRHTQAGRELIRQLRESVLSIEMPTLSNSLAAVRQTRARP